MTTNNRISDLVSSQLPAFVREDHETFVRFLEAYYEYLEQNDKVVDRAKNLYANFDIDQSIDEFVEQFYNNFLKLIPENVIVDKNMLVKHIQDFYKARGTEKSIQFLLRILFNKEATFYYPKRDVLRASDGKWFIEKSVRLGSIQYDGVDDDTLETVKMFANSRITGATSNASAIVEKVDVYYNKGVLINELKLSAQYRDFSSGEIVSATVENEGEEHTLSGTVFAGFISEAEILEAGEGYVEGTIIPVTAVTGNGATIQITSVTRGSITTIGVINGGSGFQANDYLTFASLSGTAANAYVSAVDTSDEYYPNTFNVMWSTINMYASNTISEYISNTINSLGEYYTHSDSGPVTQISVLIGGNNYLEVPVMDIASNVLVRSIGTLGRLEINDGGIDYVVGDELIFTNQSGSYGYGAMANVTSVEANGMITGVYWVENPGFTLGGEGYTQDLLPTVTVDSGTGSGANIAVTAVLGDGEVLIGRTDTIGSILSVIVLTGGSNYTNSSISVNLSSYGDGTANIIAYVVAGVFSYPGRYLNDDGFVSGYNFLQDATYYQNYSYVVRINESINKYRKALKDLIHPIGLKLFGEYLYLDESLSNDNTTVSASNTTQQTIFKADKDYTSNAFNVQITMTEHGLLTSNVVYLDFTTGDTDNISDGLYIITSATTNTFNIVVSNVSSSSGLVDVGIIT